jgi:hypothetical protein
MSPNTPKKRLPEHSLDAANMHTQRGSSTSCLSSFSLPWPATLAATSDCWTFPIDRPSAFCAIPGEHAAQSAWLVGNSNLERGDESCPRRRGLHCAVAVADRGKTSKPTLTVSLNGILWDRIIAGALPVSTSHQTLTIS